MRFGMFRRAIQAILIASLLACAGLTEAQPAPRPTKKVFMITDLEGVVGIFNFNLQCVPFKGALYPESRKLLAGEVNAAIKGLAIGGATDIVAYDNHYGGHNLSALDLEGDARLSQFLLLGGSPVSPTLGLDKSYSAIMFIGLHAMAGTPHAILPHSFTWDVKNIWVNGKKVGEIGARVMLAGELGIPAIMVSGDRAACNEFHDLVPAGKCAEVKWASGTSSTGGYSLTSSEAAEQIKDSVSLAMDQLSSIKPYPVSGPTEVKVEYVSPAAVPAFKPGPGIERVDSTTWLFKGKDFISAWLKFRSF
ncbi:MAG TPA: M55 family metallopeptidase [Terriglobia bacterium]|nr:M55 family metallopeptidase [Terriglobia bacterium]